MSTQTLNGIAINNYPVFEGSQVLTSEQLNDLFSYLDQQNRFTRSKLIGIGIVCGLQITTTSNSVVLSKGLGITSDGFLIKMPDCTMKYRRSYKLPAGVFYEPFGGFDKNGVYSQDPKIELHELLAQEPSDDAYKEIDSAFFSDKYLLIYLECFDRDPRSCLGKNCEDLGKERIFTIRKLAVDQKGLVRMLDKANGSIENPFYTNSGLPFVDLKQPIIPGVNDGCKYLIVLIDEYIDSIWNSSGEYDVFTTLFGKARQTGLLHETYSRFEPILKQVYNHKNPLTGNSRYSKLKSYLNVILEADFDNREISIQYIREYFSLITRAYHEFVAAAELLANECCPDKEFPLHILIGKINFDIDKEQDELDILGQSRYRHQFIQPKIYNQQNLLLRRVINLQKRLI